MKYEELKLGEIANRIRAHLVRFENDKAINAPTKFGFAPFYRAGAWQAGGRVMVQYIGYQGSLGLKKSEAIEYLRWLDGGNIGKHYAALSLESRLKEPTK